MTDTLKSSLLCLFALAFFSACDPEEPSPQPQKLDFSCVQLYDESGQDMGIHGGCTQSPDWAQITLSTEENAYLDFADTVGTAGTVAAVITEVAAFPIPAIRDGSMLFLLRSATADQPVKLKMAIIDEEKNVLKQFSLAIQTNQPFALQLPADVYAPGNYYRVYYRVSATGNASLFEGYGNILICKKQVVNGNIEGECF